MLLEEVYRLEREKKCSIIPGVYSFLWDGSELTQNTVRTKNVAIESNSHFIARYSTNISYDTGPVVSVLTPPLILQLKDTGSGRELFDAPQAIQNICGGSVVNAGGAGNLPFIWPEPWLIRAGGTAQASMTNIGATAVVRDQLTLFGLKVYPLSGNLADLGI
jgi:hypothetical protein